MNYTLITVLGAIAGCIFANVIMAELMEYRLEKKRAHIAIAVFTVFYILLVLTVYRRFGSTTGGQLYMFYGLLPLALFYYLISLYRDGRFFFSLFASHITLLSVIDLTNLIDSYFPTEGHLVHSILRLILFPLIFILIHKYIAPQYRRVQKDIEMGWTVHAILTGLFYVLLLYTYIFPTPLI